MDRCLTSKFWNSILSKHLFQDIDCCTGSSATYSPDDWEPAVVIRNQKIAVRLTNFSKGPWGTSCGINVSRCWLLEKVWHTLQLWAV